MSEAENELRYEDFVQARQLYWKQGVKNFGDDVVLPHFENVEPGTGDQGFLLYSPGSRGISAVFEDDAATGWFYLYDASQKKILRGTHVYDRRLLIVAEDEVDIGWAVDESVCGLAVFGQFRAFLGVTDELEMRKALRNADESGIPERDWPRGFENYRAQKIN